MIDLTNEDNMELMKRYPNNYFDLAIVANNCITTTTELNKTNLILLNIML